MAVIRNTLFPIFSIVLEDVAVTVLWGKFNNNKTIWMRKNCQVWRMKLQSQ